MGDKDNLPELPKSWVWATAEQLTSLITDGEHITPERSETGVLLLSARNVQNGWLSLDKVDYVPEHVYEVLARRLVIEPGDVLMSCSGTVGRSCVAPKNLKFALVRSVAVLKPFAGMGKFLSYSIRALYLQRQIEEKKTQTAQANIFQGKIKTLIFALPPLAEQHRIVARIEELFSELDAGVELLKKLKAKLKRYRQAVLKAAVEGKLTKDWREAHQGELEPASVLLERILKERREKWEAEQLAQMKAKGKTPKDDSWKLKYKEPVAPDTSDLPELPEGWVWASFGQLVQESQNGLSKRKGLHGTPIHVLRLADIVNGKISATEPRDILLTDEEIQSYRLQPNDLVCIRVNGSEKLVGRVIIFKEKDSWAFCDHFIRFRLVSNFLCLSFISKLFNTDAVRKYIEHHKVSSAGQNTVSQTTVAAIPIPLPSLEEQNAIDEEIERRLSVTEELEKVVEKNLKRAEKLRQSILKKAFEGKLVPQDPSDEPADKLLERIKAEKAKREAEAKAKKKQKQPGKSQQLELF
jgi:type I restriction enzyme S subunit